MLHWECNGRLSENIWILITSPVLFYSNTPKAGPIGKPLAFGLSCGILCSLIYLALALLIQAPTQLVLQSIQGHFGIDIGLIGFGLGLFLIGVVLVLSVVFVLLSLLLTSLIYHFCLMILGGAQYGLETTFRVVCYSQVALLIGWIPCLGTIISLVWWIVLMTIGLREVHNSSTGIALMAVLLPILVMGFFIGITVAVVMLMFSFALVA